MSVRHIATIPPEQSFVAQLADYVRTIPDSKRKYDNSAYVTSYGDVTSIRSLSDALLNFTGGCLWGAFLVGCAWGTFA